MKTLLIPLLALVASVAAGPALQSPVTFEVPLDPEFGEGKKAFWISTEMSEQEVDGAWIRSISARRDRLKLKICASLDLRSGQDKIVDLKFQFLGAEAGFYRSLRVGAGEGERNYECKWHRLEEADLDKLSENPRVLLRVNVW